MVTPGVVTAESLSTESHLMRVLTSTLVLGSALACTAPLASVHAGGDIEPLTTHQVASGLDHTVQVTHAPGDASRLYIVEKQGRIKVLDLGTETVNSTLFLNLILEFVVGGGTSTNDERGLLGLAFHPDFATNRYFYIYYYGNDGNAHLDRVTAIDGDTADPASRVSIMTISQPFSNHNGGWIGFGPNDGYLYIASGDGGGAGDTGNRAQDITNQRLGKILRIDVDGGTPYAIPPSNPFVGVTGDDEIWAYGLRNPWRCSFDSETGDFYIADVGQNLYEELNFQPADSPGGENYGWRCREGMHNFNFGGSCSSQTFVEPYHEYGHNTAGGFSITGGYVYRGCDIPSLQGTYFFADYAIPNIWTTDAGGTTNNLQNRDAELTGDGGAVNQVSSFGEDARGELYIVRQGNGTNGSVLRVEAESPSGSSVFDLDCSGSVDFSDLVSLLSAWGPCGACPADFDGNGSVDFSDLVALLAAWG